MQTIVAYAPKSDSKRSASHGNKNEGYYRNDNRYAMKANPYSPFSTLWKNISRIFHAMEDFLPQYGKKKYSPPPAKSLTLIYER